MRRALDLIVNRLFRSRYGLALLLAVVVVSIVGSAKLLGTPPAEGETLVPPRPTAEPTATVNPTAGDDGLFSPKPVPSPVTSPGTAKPLEVARAFTLAWLHHSGVTPTQWREGLLPFSTAELTASLAETDPAGVPAERITGEPELIPRGKAFAEVAVPVNGGQVRLRLVAPEGKWLVDGVDWVRS